MAGGFSSGFSSGFNIGSLLSLSSSQRGRHLMSLDYEFFLRNIRTPLDSDVELNPRDVSAEWTRRDLGGGSFQISLPLNRYSPEQLYLPQLVEIRRGGEQEFVGVLTRRKVVEQGKTWVVGGMDLTRFWLRRRTVGPIDADDRSGPAETVCKGYVDDYLGPSAIVTQRATSDLFLTVPWTIEADSARGGNVELPATRKSLFAVVQDICAQGNGDLIPEVVLLDDYSGYEFRVSSPVDRTIGSGNVPFSLDWDNVEDLEYEENIDEFQTYLYVSGEGDGDARLVREVSLVSAYGRSEGVFDARQASTNDQLDDVGTSELAKRATQLVTISAQPFRGSQSAVYREDWDVGSDITFADLRLREAAIDVRVVSATVKLSRAEGELITFELGQYKADSTLRRIAEAIKRISVSSNT